MFHSVPFVLDVEEQKYDNGNPKNKLAEIKVAGYNFYTFFPGGKYVPNR
jgi:hypothetical protein